MGALTLNQNERGTIKAFIRIKMEPSLKRRTPYTIGKIKQQSFGLLINDPTGT
jgi:hypothetical protein